MAFFPNSLTSGGYLSAGYSPSDTGTKGNRNTPAEMLPQWQLEDLYPSMDSEIFLINYCTYRQCIEYIHNFFVDALIVFV